MKILRRLFLGLATAVGAFVLALLCLAIVASVRFYSDRNQANSASLAAIGTEAHLKVSGAERQRIVAEYPAYYSRRKEQTYLTLADWAQVYSYNEFGDFLASGGDKPTFRSYPRSGVSGAATSSRSTRARARNSTGRTISSPGSSAST
jgi:hypothetical protein